MNKPPKSSCPLGTKRNQQERFRMQESLQGNKGMPILKGSCKTKSPRNAKALPVYRENTHVLVYNMHLCSSEAISSSSSNSEKVLQSKKTDCKLIQHMDSKMGAAATHTNTFEPSSDLIQENECDTLLLYLPGFTKEQLRVQLIRSRALRISGERPYGDNKLSTFQKDYPVSANCDTSKITAKFEGGILYVRQPKLIVPPEKEDKRTPPSETPRPRMPAGEPPAPKTDQEQAHIQKTTPLDDQNKQTSDGKDFPEKSAQVIEEKTTKDKEKSTEPEGDKMDGRNYEQEKPDSMDNDQKPAKRTSRDKREKLSGNGDADLENKGTKRHGIPKVDDYKFDVGSPAAKLKMTRQMVAMFLTVLFAFVLGMYVRSLSWFSTKTEN